MAPRAGLTLIELVAALALLAMIVTAALPVLQGSAAAMQSTAPMVTVEDLGQVADRIMRNPEAFGIDSLQALERTEIDWPIDLPPEQRNASVAIERVRVGDAEHAWLRFSVGEVATLRWVQLEEQP